jgi:hypothetical protein
MAIIYTWEVTSIRVVNTDNLENVVIHTYWFKTGVDEDGNDGTFYGATPLSKSEDQDDFIPFDQLTEGIVLGWIQSAVIDQTHIDEQIQKQIDRKKTPSVEKPLPWAPPKDNTPIPPIP